LGLCRLFQENIYDGKKNEYIVNNVALQCRNNENLCGKNGTLYQSINTKYKNYEYVRKITNDGYEENNFKKIEEMEIELLDIFQKMRKHNTKRIYKKTKDLIELLKHNHKLL